MGKLIKKTKDWAVQLDKEQTLQLHNLNVIFRNNGFDADQEHVGMTDALDVPNAAMLIPRVLTQFVQEGVEPLLIGRNLLQRIEYVPGMQTVFPAIDQLQAREVGDGMSLPIFNISMGGGQTYGVSVKRHGLMLRIADRFVEQNSYPWINWWVKLAGAALARHGEEFIFRWITSLGTLVFDNSLAARTIDSGTKLTTSGQAQPIKGATTGRFVTGKLNGSMVMDDIFDMFAQTLTQGFTPDTLLVHPMTYLLWVKDPVMREFALQAGGGSFFQAFTGNAAAKAFEGQYNYFGLGQGLGQQGQYKGGAQTATGQTGTAQGLPQNQTSAPTLMSYLGLNFSILTSPFVRFDPIGRTTDVMLFDRRNLGAMVVDEDPHVNSWNDPHYGIRNIGVEESYGFGILNEGQAITVAKNVAIRPNEFVLPARAVASVNDANFQTIDSITNFGASPTNVLA